ncbi:MAG: phosphoesterase [Gemmatimonadota bacterium]|nr:phosphoesterase [Gemmatimonadota bacterium]
MTGHRFLTGLAALVVLAAPAAAQRRYTPPPVKHVFVIVLENKSYDETFGPGSGAPYLARTLVGQGALLRQYFGTGHASLDNYVSMVSGLAPTRATQTDCERYVEFVQTGTAPDGQPVGEGCVYPAHVKTIANQLMARGLTWKGYMEDMGNDPSREAARCGHAAIGTVDRTERAAHNDQYAAKHNPFVYFHAIVDSASCQANDVPLTELTRDLASAATTPNYSYIVPNLCNDGHDLHCANGDTGGLVGINRFLTEWVPRIVHSPAFRKDGLLIITFDEAQSADKTACCNEQSGPNTRSAGAGGPGGGRIGTVVLSPFVRPGTVSDVPYTHYSMLKSVEEIFGLPYLGYAGQPGLVAFGKDVYTRPGGGK